MRKLHEEVVQMSMTPVPATLPSLSQPALITSRGIPYNQLTEEEKRWKWFPGSSVGYAGTTWKWTALAL